MVCVLKLDITVNAKLDMEETIVILLDNCARDKGKTTKHVKIQYSYDNSAYSRIVLEFAQLSHEQRASTVTACIHSTHALQIHRDKPTNKSSYFDLLHNTNVSTSNIHIPNKLCARHK